MTEQEELEIYREMFRSSFWLSTNMNDTFCYACGDVGQMDCMDIPKILPIIKEYGFHEVDIAYESLRRGEDPIKPRCTPTFYEVKSKLADLKLYLVE